MHPDVVEFGQMMGIFVSTIVCGIGVVTAIRLTARAIEARIDRQRLRPAAVDDDRLERLQQAVDAIAIEVERISEGQRFTTKLLSEKASRDNAQASAS